MNSNDNLHAFLTLVGVLGVALCLFLANMQTPRCRPSLEFLDQLEVSPSDLAWFYSAICSNRICDTVFLSALSEKKSAEISAWNELENRDTASAPFCSPENQIHIMVRSRLASDIDQICRENIRDLLEFCEPSHNFMSAEEYDAFMGSHDPMEEITNDVINARIYFESDMIAKFMQLFPVGEVAPPRTVGDRYSMIREYCAQMDGHDVSLVIWIFFKMLDYVDPFGNKLSREAWRAFKGVMERKDGKK